MAGDSESLKEKIESMRENKDYAGIEKIYEKEEDANRKLIAFNALKEYYKLYSFVEVWRVYQETKRSVNRVEAVDLLNAWEEFLLEYGDVTYLALLEIIREGVKMKSRQKAYKKYVEKYGNDKRLRETMNKLPPALREQIQGRDESIDKAREMRKAFDRKTKKKSIKEILNADIRELFKKEKR